MARKATLLPLIQCEVLQAVEYNWTANIFVICLDRPNSDLNILDMEFGEQLSCAVFTARDKALCKEIDLVVVCSGKENSFMAGADIPTQLKMIGVEGEYTYVRGFFCWGGEKKITQGYSCQHLIKSLTGLYAGIFPRGGKFGVRTKEKLM